MSLTRRRALAELLRATVALAGGVAGVALRRAGARPGAPTGRGVAPPPTDPAQDAVVPRGGASPAGPGAGTDDAAREPASGAAPLFPISLAQWSLHRAHRAGELSIADFAAAARGFGIDAVEYVSTFFAGRGGDETFVAELRARADDAGVRSLLIMVDGEGELGHADEAARAAAVQAHRPWIEAVAALGGRALRVNAAGRGAREEVAARVADSLHRLAELADPHGVDVVVENHGGYSSDGGWLAGVLAAADHPRVGSLPDFGNFDLGGGRTYDRYRGVAELMPFARAVSAKSHDFDERGDETSTDYRRMLDIVLDAGYRGHVGIEYEGSRLSEPDGIRATKALLERVRAEREAREPR